MTYVHIPAFIGMVALVEAGWCTEAEADAIVDLLNGRPAGEQTVSAVRATLTEALQTVRARREQVHR